MSNLLFPRLIGLTWDIKKRPTWGTAIQTAISGREVRVTNRVQPIWEYELTFSVLQDSNRPPTFPPGTNTSTFSGGHFPATTYYVQTTWLSPAGESEPSPEGTQAVGAGNLLSISPQGTPPTGATGWNAYVGLWSGGEMLQGTQAISSPWNEPTTGIVASYPPYNFSYWTDFEALHGFYHQRQGAFDSFLLYDPSDFELLNGAINIGVGDGTTTAFELAEDYGAAIMLTQNPVQVQVFLNGVQQSSGYTIGSPGSQTAGIVTFTSAPGAGVVVSANWTFLQRVRFKADQVEFNEFLSNLWEASSIELISVKL